MNERAFEVMTSLRIYLKRGDNKKSSHWWGRLTERPLSTYLIQTALKAGITHASVNLGHMGFAKDAKAISNDISEIPMSTLPVCVELLAPKRLLEQFIHEEAKQLKDATLMMVDGIHVSPLYLAEVENALRIEKHSVQYITEGLVTIPIDTVKVEKSALLPSPVELDAKMPLPVESVE